MAAWYFAYGANMSTEVLVKRRRVQPLSGERARLDGYRLTFKQAGIPWIEPCFTTIESAQGESVYGVLYRLSDDAEDRIDHFEGVGYVRIPVRVEGTKSGWVNAWAYRARHPRDDLQPSKRYVNLLVDGAREFGLPGPYITALENQPCTHIPLLSALLPPLIDLIEGVTRKSARARRIFYKAMDVIVRISKRE